MLEFLLNLVGAIIVVAVILGLCLGLLVIITDDIHPPGSMP